jgi:hypothetical protein
MPLASRPEPGAFIEFAVHDAARFGQLQAVFAALQQAKRSGHFPTDDYWLAFFDAAARAYFWWPTEAEYADWLRRWYATPVPQRESDPSIQTGWLFEAMLAGFRDGEFDLVACRLVDGGRARLELEPYPWPHAGIGCPKALVECFGFPVTAEQLA